MKKVISCHEQPSPESEIAHLISAAGLSYRDTKQVETNPTAFLPDFNVDVYSFLLLVLTVPGCGKFSLSLRLHALIILTLPSIWCTEP